MDTDKHRSLSVVSLTSEASHRSSATPFHLCSSVVSTPLSRLISAECLLGRNVGPDETAGNARVLEGVKPLSDRHSRVFLADLKTIMVHQIEIEFHALQASEGSVRLVQKPELSKRRHS